MSFDRFTWGVVSPVFGARLQTALLQAVALSLLAVARDAPQAWPATHPSLYEPLLLVAWAIPPLVLLGLGRLPARALLTWTLLAACAVALLGFCDATRGSGDQALPKMLGPSLRLLVALAPSLFVADVLVVDAVVAGRWMPPYERHFDTAWKQAVQILFGIVFVGIFWGVLELGAALFRLIGIEGFQHVIERWWFDYPATTLSAAVAIHVTDIQPGLIRGIRALALTLLSWLTPVLAAILLAFLCSLPFISLAGLWRTHIATALLLTAAGLLVFFVNSCYQDGEAERATSPIKRVAASVAAVELLPLVGLAAWALALRVGQYGWSGSRVIAVAATLVAGFYAVGYGIAVVRSASWLKRIEPTNVAAAYLILALVLALFTPLADPARLMVADQLGRLRSGVVTPEQFDYAALKFDGARWGYDALAELQSHYDGPEQDLVRSRADAAMAMQFRFAQGAPAAKRTADDLAARIEVLPEGRPLPPAFADQAFWLDQRPTLPACLTNMSTQKCILRMITVSSPGPEAVLFVDGFAIDLFEPAPNARWTLAAHLAELAYCSQVRQAIVDGTFRMEPHPFSDLVVGDRHVVLTEPSKPCR